jgi:hypothetical protein
MNLREAKHLVFVLSVVAVGLACLWLLRVLP